MQEAWFVGHGGTPVFHRWGIPSRPRAVVLLLHGYSEHSGRHLGTLQHLHDHGFACFAPDHRGHGRTARTLGLIRNMDAVIADVGILHRRALESCPGLPVFILGHSMGGLIALRYTQLHGDGLTGIIVNGPGLRVPESIPRPMILAAKVVARVAPRTPMQPFHEPGRGHSNADQHAQDADDPLCYTGWIRAGTGATVLHTIRSTHAALDQVRTPALITTGAQDRTVPPAVAEEVYARLGSQDRRLHMFPGLAHEVYLEHQAPSVLALWRAWLEERL